MVCEAAAASGGGDFRRRARTRNTNDILTPFVHTPVGTPRPNKSRVALICNAISSGKNSYVIARRVRMVTISWLSLVL